MNEKKNYHHGDLREKLIESALKIIQEEGLEKLTMRRLGMDIGVSRTAPYRHFSDKTALLCSIAEEGYKVFTQRIKESGRNLSDSPLKRLKNIGISYVDFATSNPVHYRLMFGNEIVEGKRTAELEKCAEEAFNETLDSIRICQEKKLIRPLNPYIIANALWSMSHGISTLMNDGQIQSANAFKGMPFIMMKDKKREKADVRQIVAHMTDILMYGFISKDQTESDE